MTEGNGNLDCSDRFSTLRRYVPLVVWLIVISVLLLIPLQIVSYGYLPGDDALRHAAKAVSGKSWSEILILNPVYKIDHEFGWNLFLEKIYQWTSWGADSLVVFSVIILFVTVTWLPLPWLRRRPEAWLAALLAGHLAWDLDERLMLGRPYLVTFAATLAILLMWQQHRASHPPKRLLLLATMLFALCTFIHGTWYLWPLLLGAFIFAGEFYWAASLSFCWVAGVLIGSTLTGHPLEYPVQAVKLLTLAIGMQHNLLSTATELQPLDGDYLVIVILGALLILRRLTNLNVVPLTKDPAFWLTVFGWTLGFRIRRFWDDWGWPALLVLIVWNLQSYFKIRFEEKSFQRLGLTIGLAVILFLALTNNNDSRWSSSAGQAYLTESNPNLKGWMPEHGGIFYSPDMTLFYQTFFKNPHGDWRYMLGFEPTWMPPEDLKVFQNFCVSGGDPKTLIPWINKMKPEDRLAERGQAADPPNIPQLEWNYGVSGIWIGRLPRPVEKGTVPPTVPAKTNSVSGNISSP